MAKRFDIHEWQAKHLFEQVQIKKVVDQSMNNDDIGKLQDVIRNNDLGKVLNTIAVVIDRTGGRPEVAQKIADLVPGIEQKFNKDELDEHHAGDYNPGFLKQTVSIFLDKLKKKTKEGKDYKVVEKIMEKHFSAKKQNEASMTGTGASFQAGAGEGYMTPFAFKKKRKKQ